MKKQAGFTILESLMAITLLSILIFAAINLISGFNNSSSIKRRISTKDRILVGIRTLAGMPATLRASARATDPSSGAAVNPRLRNCLANNVAGACIHNEVVPFSLFSPAITTGGLIRISAPDGSTEPMRFDSFGSPCANDEPNCFLNVYTSFKAQCPPAPLTGPPPPATDPTFIALFDPLPTCTIADTIIIIFRVELDASAAGNPSVQAFAKPITDSVSVSVKATFGNDPR